MFWAYPAADVGYTDGQVSALDQARFALREGWAFRLPNQSFGRGKYSQPTDLLFVLGFDFGVAAFSAAEVSTTIRAGLPSGGTGAEFVFGLVHTPRNDNFAHSELTVQRDGVPLGPDESKKVSPGVRKKFRVQLADALWLERPSGDATRGWLRTRVGL